MRYEENSIILVQFKRIFEVCLFYSNGYPVLDFAFFLALKTGYLSTEILILEGGGV